MGRIEVIEANGDIDVAATIAANGAVAGHRRIASYSCDLVRLSAILRITHVRIVIGIRIAIHRRPEIEVPKIGPARNAADRSDVAVAKFVATDAWLDILP